MAKIAVVGDQHGNGHRISPSQPQWRQIAAGDGWALSDVVCTAGPSDRPYEEQHTCTAIAIVVRGTFQYRSPLGRDLMTPGSWLLGNPGDGFCCGHEHGTGDRCVSFSYSADVFERVAKDATGLVPRFTTPRLPPSRALARLAASAEALLAGFEAMAAQELSLQVAAQAAQAGGGAPARRSGAEAISLARVTRVVRMIDRDPDVPHDLPSLARVARLSPFHFLRVFEGLTGTTPHQYLLRVRLRRAAVRLRTEPARISDIALDCGFGDVSNFNRSFRAEFGVNPRTYRSAPRR